MQKNQSFNQHWFEILAVISACWASITCGLIFTWPSPSIPKIINDNSTYEISLEQASYFTVLPPIGAIVSSFAFAYLNDSIGRKYTLLSIVIPQSLSLLLIANARSVWAFYIARFIGGFGDACLFSSLPVYIGEITTPKIRGTWGNLMTLNIYVAQFLINVYGSYVSIETAAYISLSVPLLFVATFSWMPESPYFHLMRGRLDAARASLRRLRRRSDVEDELVALKAAMERQMLERGSWRDLLTIRANQRAILAASFLRGAQQFAGVTSFMLYTQLIFLKAGTEIAPSMCSIIFTGASAVLNLLACFFMDRIGRRKAFLYSLLGTGLAMATFFVYFLLEEFVDVRSVNWVPLAAAGVWVVFFALGLGLVPTLMLGELFSVSVKGKALILMNIFFALFVSGSTKLFQLLLTRVGTFAPFLFFTVVCFGSAAASMFIVPETKGKTLEEIQQELKGDKK